MTDTRKLVYVIDDDLAVREALDDLLASVNLETASFADVETFLSAEHPHCPSCLVLDVRMPGQSGMDFHDKMKNFDLDIPVIFITGHGDIAMSVTAMKRGAVDFLEKPFRDQDLLEAINRALTVSEENLRHKDSHVQLQRRYSLLNSGERAVMDYVVQGFLNKQIAAELNVSEITVKVRRGNVMQKMKAKTLADLIRFGQELHKVGT
ncbi:response regulator transcription factor [Bartonella sp. HY761]|uniref:response regulator transcription factor n=1 Tax=Bartonella sp. HY761 TaxID=2979330 RepID=UPI0021FE1FB5|nr:response regulator [Bartonella sp. HY761]UXN06369.1 response regulator [Bartonella sp. HY761]